MKNTIVIILASILLILLGSYLGVNKYKHSCEKIENAQQTASWLECKL